MLVPGSFFSISSIWTFASTNPLSNTRTFFPKAVVIGVRLGRCSDGGWNSGFLRDGFPRTPWEPGFRKPPFGSSFSYSILVILSLLFDSRYPDSVFILRYSVSVTQFRLFRVSCPGPAHFNAGSAGCAEALVSAILVQLQLFGLFSVVPIHRIRPGYLVPPHFGIAPGWVLLRPCSQSVVE